MKTQPVLDSVLEHLTARIPAELASVEFFPDNTNDYYPSHPEGAVLIGYQGSSFGESQDVTFVNQKRFITLALTTVNRSQWGDSGSLLLLDLVREAMAGFEAKNCIKASIESEQFIGEEGGLWYYQMLLRLPTQNVQHNNADRI